MEHQIRSTVHFRNPTESGEQLTVAVQVRATLSAGGYAELPPIATLLFALFQFRAKQGYAHADQYKSRIFQRPP